MRTMGWDWWTYHRQPHFWLDDILRYIQTENAAYKEKAEIDKTKGK